MTKDHTLAQVLVDAGITNPDDDSTKTLHHVLTAALGATDEQTDPQVLRFTLMDNDQILLCTDGLTEMVSTEAISAVLSQASSSEAACDSLINLALSVGGMENVSVVLARYRFPPTGRRMNSTKRFSPDIESRWSWIRHLLVVHPGDYYCDHFSSQLRGGT